MNPPPSVQRLGTRDQDKPIENSSGSPGNEPARVIQVFALPRVLVICGLIAGVLASCLPSGAPASSDVQRFNDLVEVANGKDAVFGPYSGTLHLDFSQPDYDNAHTA